MNGVKPTAWRTPRYPGVTPTSPCVESVRNSEAFSLARPLPSPTSATDRSALFGQLTGTTGRSDSSPPFTPDVWPWPSPAGLPLLLAANDEVSRFSCMQFLSVPGVCDYARSVTGSRPLRPLQCGLPLPSTGSAPRTVFTKLNTQPTDASCLRFDSGLATAPARLEVRWFATPFLQDSFIPYCMPVYPGARTDGDFV